MSGCLENYFNINAVCQSNFIKSLEVKNVNVKNISKKCKILSYNISGLSNKNLFIDFFNFINKFELIFLYETYLSETSLTCYENKFQDYELKIVDAIRIHARGRASGGCIFGVKKELKSYCSYEFKSSDDAIYVDLRFDGELFRILPCYVNCNHWETDYNKIKEFVICGTISNLLVVGDLNARVGTTEGVENVRRSLERQSKDALKNGKGNQILELCNSVGLRVLNGTSDGDKLGEHTFVGKQGSSVIDYGLAGGMWNSVITDFEVEQVPFSDHMPIVIYFNIGATENEESVKLKLMPKLLWKDSNATAYRNQLDICLRTQESSDLRNIEECIKKAAPVQTIYNRIGLFKEPWFDSECMMARKQSYAGLERYRRVNDESAKRDYLQLNRKFKTLCKEKKLAHYEIEAKSLVSCKNTSEFWKKAQKINGKVYVINKHLNCETLRTHYFELLNHLSTSSDMVQFAQPAFDDELLDGTIQKEEVYASINGLKDSKAAGSNRIPAEFYKYGSDELINKLTAIFNNVMDHGIIPQEFKEALIFPIHKKGSTMDPANYRGISFLNASYKIFTSILQNRLKTWIDANKLLKEFQAGFRQGYSTVDNIFVLRSIADFFLDRNKKLYVFFVDFKAAFDTIDRNALMYKMYRMGMSYKFGRILQNLYLETKAAVWDGENISQWFETKTGLRQGCMLSPSLFALFIDDITDCLPGGVEYAGTLIKALLFADDIVLFAQSPQSLQLMINKLSEYCRTWKLVVSLEKSKVMVFRKGGGRASGQERWTFNNERIEIVNEYKYLGIYITKNNSMERHLTDKLQKAKTTINMAWRNIFNNR